MKLRGDSGDTAMGLVINPETKPAVVHHGQEQAGPRELFLDWDRALDDQGHLRHCLVCGCPDLYVSREVPRVTVFVLIVLAAVLSMLMFGFGQIVWGVVVLVVLLLADLGIMLFARRRLECYNCAAVFSDLPIRRSRRGWEQAVAEKYSKPDADKTAAKKTSKSDAP